MGNAVEKYLVSKEVVDAYNNLPPTYEIGEVGKFDQFIPDPVNENSIQQALDRVDRAEENFDRVFKKN